MTNTILIEMTEEQYESLVAVLEHYESSFKDYYDEHFRSELSGMGRVNMTPEEVKGLAQNYEEMTNLMKAGLEEFYAAGRHE